MSEDDFKLKYLKYKAKYLKLKEMIGSGITKESISRGKTKTTSPKSKSTKLRTIIKTNSFKISSQNNMEKIMGITSRDTGKQKKEKTELFMAAIKREIEEKEVNLKRDNIFQCLINFIGGPDMLKSMIEFLGREESLPDGTLIENIQILEKKRGILIPPKFTGLVFNVSHWKGYENGVEKYDSYKTNIQSYGTMNYCQSFAAFLFASRATKDSSNTGYVIPRYGDQPILIPGQYTDNVKKMSQLWLDFIVDLESDMGQKEWLISQIDEFKLQIDEETKERPYEPCEKCANIKNSEEFILFIKLVLNEIITNTKIADDFARSKL